MMLRKFQNHLTTLFPALQEKKILLAVSGGIDSMVLLHLLHQLDYNISVAHCNFQLRGAESNLDEDFVKTQCEEKQIPFYVKRFETQWYAQENNMSIQMAARELRYDWFFKLLDQEKTDYLLTAHHQDDAVETFLINLTRGTGLEGLTGIPTQNERIIRPLLSFSRAEIALFANENTVQWREDSSNASEKYLRNKIRHAVIPILKDLNPSFLNSFQKTLQYLNQAAVLVEDATQIAYENTVEIHQDQIKIALKKLFQLSDYKAYLYQWLKPYKFTAWQDIEDLVQAQSGKQIFSETHILLKDRNYLILFPKETSSLESVYWVEKAQKEVNIPLKITFCNVSDISLVNSNSIFVDEDKLQFPLMIKKWEAGDYFYPVGMQGKKKLSKYFKDEKLSLPEKAAIWVLCSGNHIVWIIGKRQDRRFIVDTETNNKLNIQLIQ